MQLTWNKCQGDVWCKLNTVNLPHPHFDTMQGVYIIWHGGPNPAFVYVGQGTVRQRLTEHRNDPKIQQYDQFTLYVTWAAVPEVHRLGVEHYLALRLKPKEGSHDQTDAPVEVNLPW